MDIQIPQIIFQIINFSLVVIVLNKFLYKPITNILEQRQKKIEAASIAADKTIKNQEDISNTKKDVLNQARQEAEQLKKEAKKAADTEAKAIISRAKASADKILSKERNSLQASFDQEQKSLEKNFSKLVAQTTENLLKKYLSAAEQKRIIDAQVKELTKFSLSQ